MCLDRSLGSFCLFCILKSARVDARIGDNRLFVWRLRARRRARCCLLVFVCVIVNKPETFIKTLSSDSFCFTVFGGAGFTLRNLFASGKARTRIVRTNSIAFIDFIAKQNKVEIIELASFRGLPCSRSRWARPCIVLELPTQCSEAISSLLPAHRG